MPWWGWGLAVTAGIGILWVWSVRLFRKNIRREFIAALREAYPDVQILAEGQYQLTFRTPDFGECTANLLNLYYACGRAGSKAETWTPMIEQFLASLRDQVSSSKSLTLDSVGDKLLPRLVPTSFLQSLPAGATLLWRPLDQTGLATAYVIDRPNSVEYITGAHLKELGLDSAQLHEQALANLKRTFGPEAVIATLENGNMNVIKLLDSHDAARVLLVPQYVPEAKEIAALIPDVDTLALAPIPADGDWSALRRACVPGGGKPLLDCPLRVSRAGFKLA